MPEVVNAWGDDEEDLIYVSLRLRFDPDHFVFTLTKDQAIQLADQFRLLTHTTD